MANHPQPESEDHTSIDELLYTALGHKIRRSIIKIIGDRGKAGFINLKQQLGISTGAIYHHLDTLSAFIIQDKSKKYHLTELGKKAYNLLLQTEIISPDNAQTEADYNVEGIVLSEKKPVEGSGIDETLPHDRDIFDIPFFKEGLGKILWFIPLIHRCEKKARDALVVNLLIIGILAVICGFFDIENYFYFFLVFQSFSSPESAPSNISKLHLIPFINVFVGYAILGAIIELLVSFFSSRGSRRSSHEGQEGQGAKSLFRFLGITYIPSFLYVVLVIALKSIIRIELIILLLLLTQIWTIGIFSYLLVKYKGVDAQKSLMIALFLNYFLFIAVLFLKNPIFMV